MALVEMARCDECGATAEITVRARRPDAINKPLGWYVVIAAEQVDMVHLCSAHCLKTWAHMNAREPEPPISAVTTALGTHIPLSMRYG